MDELTFAEFGVIADTGIVIEGQPVHEYRTITLNIDPCHVDAIIEELKTHYVSVGYNGNIELIHEMCQEKQASVTES
ncbi:MAG: hypothetical protein ACRCX2_38865 [Paraclostridium sp.]